LFAAIALSFLFYTF